MKNPCQTCPEHGAVATNIRNLWLIVGAVLAGCGGFLYWNQAQVAQARMYTDIKVQPVVEMQQTLLTMEINLRTFLESQGYKYQERTR